VIKEFSARGALCSIPGKGTFIGAPKPSGPVDEKEPKQSSVDTIVSATMNNISRGELKRGDILTSVKAMSLQFGVAPTTVTRAYEKLCRQGYATKIGKRFFIGDFSSLRRFGSKQEVFLFDIDNDLGTLFEKHLRGNAVHEMEDELLACNVKLQYQISADLDENRELAARACIR